MCIHTKRNAAPNVGVAKLKRRGNMMSTEEIAKKHLILRWLEPKEKFISSYGLITNEDFCERVRHSMYERKGLVSEVIRAMKPIYSSRRGGEEKVKLRDEERVSLKMISIIERFGE